MTKAITKNSKKGFTLVELVIVIAILAILAAIAIPVVNSIINTASKNGALSNAETIELAVKECQADIAAKNDEVYNGATVNGVTIPNAATAHGSIEIQHVAVVKGINEAFATVTYNGVDYEPYWDLVEDKCVFLGTVSGTLQNIDGSAAPASSVQLSSAASGITTGATVAIDAL